jgi:hypothetical protein
MIAVKRWSALRFNRHSEIISESHSTRILKQVHHYFLLPDKPVFRIHFLAFVPNLKL